jgi:arylsulfatase A-like enzyme
MLAATALAADPPNVVLIFADDLGYSDLGCYGSEIETPNLDRLAVEGTMLTHFRVSATCSPSRAMLMTGVDNHLNGFGNMYPFIEPAQEDKPGYENVLNPNAITIATYMKDAGYHTYMAGKWNIGDTETSLPSKRGFERTFALMETGGSNWEKRSYLALYDDAHFFKNGEPFNDFPADYFSTDYFTDTIIGDIERDRADGKPFFAYLPYQAVHIPLQAPPEYIEKYSDTYKPGWEKIQTARHKRMEEMGIVPKGLILPKAPGVRAWDNLTSEEQKIEAKQMAVYAAMIDNMDANIGKLIDYLERIGEYENTVIIFLSDNGPANGDPYGSNLDFYNDFDRSYENMGLSNNLMAYGTEWASVSATPLSSFKRTSGEGGIRVPFIVRYPKEVRAGMKSNAFTSVYDLVPTLLTLAGIPIPDGEYKGRKILPLRGQNLTPLLKGDRDEVFSPDETFCYELCGDIAVYRGDYKLVRHLTQEGRIWGLYNIAEDLTEQNDLIEAEPEIHQELLAAYEAYADDVGLVEVSEGYNPRRAVGTRIRAKVMERSRKAQ